MPSKQNHGSNTGEGQTYSRKEEMLRLPYPTPTENEERGAEAISSHLSAAKEVYKLESGCNSVNRGW